MAEEYRCPYCHQKARHGLRYPIALLNLSPRLYHALDNYGVTHMSELQWIDHRDVASIKQCGRKSMNEIRDVCAELGIRLPWPGQGQ